MTHWAAAFLYLLIGLVVEAKKGFLLEAHSSFSLDFTVHVLLAGLNADGNTKAEIDPGDLHMSLVNSLEVVRPAVVNTKKSLHSEYNIVYQASHLLSGSVSQIEKLLSTHMNLTAVTPGPGGSASELIYEVDATSLEYNLEDIIQKHIDPASEGEGAAWMRRSRTVHSAASAFNENSQTHGTYTVVVLNPDKKKLTPKLQTLPGQAPIPQGGKVPFKYCYKYGGGAGTQQWVGRYRYIIIDLSAGPCQYGTTDSHQQAVSRESIPKLHRAPDLNIVDEQEELVAPDGSFPEEQPHRPSVLFISRLVSVITSAVEHVLLPDLSHTTEHHAEKLIIPVVVFRNHHRFDPFKPDSPEAREFWIDMSTLRLEIERLIFPGQELLLLPIVHDLSSHKKLAVSVRRAIKAESAYVITPQGHTVNTITYLDSATIKEALESLDDLLANTHLAGDIDTTGLTGKTRIDSAGHRVVPVYIFSLLGLPAETLLDSTSLHVASESDVLVLQTGAQDISLPFFIGSDGVTVSGRKITRQIIAGLTKVIGCALEPHLRLSAASKSPLARATSSSSSSSSPAASKSPPSSSSSSSSSSDPDTRPASQTELKKLMDEEDSEGRRRGAVFAPPTILTNYLWATGRTPFGPFATSLQLSQITVDNSQRNPVLSRIDNAILTVRRAVEKVDGFIAEYFFDGFEEALEVLDRAAVTFGGPKLWMMAAKPRGGGSQGLLAAAIVSRLLRDVESLEKHFLDLATIIQERKLVEASRASSALLLEARSFEGYVDGELERVREDLGCCRRTFQLPGQGIPWGALLMGLSAFIFLLGAYFAAPGVIARISGARRQSYFASRSSAMRKRFD